MYDVFSKNINPRDDQVWEGSDEERQPPDFPDSEMLEHSRLDICICGMCDDGPCCHQESCLSKTDEFRRLLKRKLWWLSRKFKFKLVQICTKKAGTMDIAN